MLETQAGEYTGASNRNISTSNEDNSSSSSRTSSNPNNKQRKSKRGDPKHLEFVFFFFISLSLIFIPFIHNRIMLSNFFSSFFKSRDRQTAQLVVHRLQSDAVQTITLAESHLLFGVESRMRAQELHSGVGLQMEK